MNTTTVLYHTKSNGSKVYLMLSDEPKRAVIFSSILHQHLENAGINLNHNDGRIDRIRELQKQQQENHSNEVVEAPSEDTTSEAASSDQENDQVEEPQQSGEVSNMLEEGSLTMKVTHESVSGSTTNMEVTDTPKNALAAVTLLMRYFEEQVV